MVNDRFIILSKTINYSQLIYLCNKFFFKYFYSVIIFYLIFIFNNFYVIKETRILIYNKKNLTCISSLRHNVKCHGRFESRHATSIIITSMSITAVVFRTPSRADVFSLRSSRYLFKLISFM